MDTFNAEVREIAQINKRQKYSIYSAYASTYASWRLIVYRLLERIFYWTFLKGLGYWTF